MLRKLSNRPKGQTSGPSLRQIKSSNGEIVETFPMQKSHDQVREKVELIEVVEVKLPEEVGTGGRPCLNRPSDNKMDYTALDLFSEEVFKEEILFQGRLNKFQAGFKSSFNPKWVTVTRTVLRYYKNMESSIQNPSKPLLTIPMRALETCQRVSFDLGMSKK